MPEWIFKLKKTDKREVKKLEKRQPKRDTISTKPVDNRDWAFRKKLDKLDKEYERKIELARESGFVSKDEKDPQILMAARMQQIMGELQFGGE